MVKFRRNFTKNNTYHWGGAHLQVRPQVPNISTATLIMSTNVLFKSKLIFVSHDSASFRRPTLSSPLVAGHQSIQSSNHLSCGWKLLFLQICSPGTTRQGRWSCRHRSAGWTTSERQMVISRYAFYFLAPIYIYIHVSKCLYHIKYKLLVWTYLSI